MNDEILGYHRQLKRSLNCPKAMREKFLADTRRMTDDFLTENPGASFDELKRAVGEPQELAAMFLEGADSGVVERYRKRKSWAKRAVAVLLVLAFVAVTAFSIYVANAKQNAALTRESTIIIYETQEE